MVSRCPIRTGIIKTMVRITVSVRDRFKLGLAKTSNVITATIKTGTNSRISGSDSFKPGMSKPGTSN